MWVKGTYRRCCQGQALVPRGRYYFRTTVEAMSAAATPTVLVRPQDLGLIRKHWAPWTDRGHEQDGVSLPESRSFKGAEVGGWGTLTYLQ